MLTQTITVKIDKKTNKLLNQISKDTKKAKSEIVRNAITKFINIRSKSGADTLLEIADEAKKYEYEAPDDFIENMNDYLYGKKS